MTKTTFHISVKTDLRNDHFTVMAYGTKKHMRELFAQYIAIPETVAARIIRDKDDAIVESYEREGGLDPESTKRYRASFYDTDTNELVREFVQETDDFGAFVKRCENRCEWNEVWYYTELRDEDVEPIDVRGEDETEKMHRRSRADHLRDEVARHDKDIADASAIRSETLKELSELAASEDADYQSLRALVDRIARCDNRIEVATAYRAEAMAELYDIESEDAFIDGPVSVRIADDSVSFKAEFLVHDEWNGWALPYFSREELEKVIRHMNKISYDEWHVFCLTTDEYRVTNYSDGTLIEAFKGIDKNGKHVYPIGTGIWSWEVAEVD